MKRILAIIFLISLSVLFYVVFWQLDDVAIFDSAADLRTDDRKALSFHLRQDHSSYKDIQRPFAIFCDRKHNDDHPTPTLLARPTTVYRPKYLDPISSNGSWHRMSRGHDNVIWEPVRVYGPDIENRHTLQQLARMTGNAYALPDEKNWYELDEVWNQSFPIGWEGKADGFRGHVFLSSDNSTVILSIKGTTLQGPTSKKDKFNDNLLFSCCCARVDITWIFHTVCDCYRKGNRCDNGCLTNALIQESLFYSVGVDLVAQLMIKYPRADIWLTGHSLGGALAALLGSRFGLPAVSFESPGEKLASERLLLPSPPISPVTHVFHNADPIALGTCTGLDSVCAAGGFAMETGCHTGKRIVYDVVNVLGWKPNVQKHVIKDVIHKVLEAEVEWEEGREVPLARDEEDDCVDCFKWEFGDFDGDCAQ